MYEVSVSAEVIFQATLTDCRYVVCPISRGYNRSVKVIETDSLGGVSGGTIASLFGQVNQALADGPEGWRRFHGDMYLLNPPDNIPDWDKTNGGVGYDKTTKIIHGPFVMAGINARVSMSYAQKPPLSHMYVGLTSPQISMFHVCT